MAVDKFNATIEFLLNCNAIRQNQVFFNFLNAKEDSKQFVTLANDKAINRTYIDGSVLKRFTFTIIDYRSVTYQPIVKSPTDGTYPNENLEEFLDIQGIIDWITEQSELHNYPNFGEYCIIDDMRTTTENPNLNGVDTSIQPPLAKYSMSIQIDYLDISKRIY